MAVTCDCTNKDDYRQSSIQEATGTYPSVFSVDDYSFDPQGSSGTFSYTGEGTWRVTQMPDWLSVNPANGNEGSTLVTISAGLNVDWSERTGSVVFQGANGQTHEITVRQDCPKLGLSVKSQAPGMSEVFEHDANKGDPEGRFLLPFLWSHASGRTEPVQLTISSNVHWEITLSDTKYFSLSTDKAEGLASVRSSLDGIVYINTVNNNYTKDDVSAVFSLKAYTDDTYTKRLSSEAVGNWTINLSQSHLLFMLGLSEDESELTADDLDVLFDELGYVDNTSREDQAVSVKCELPWSVTMGEFSSLNDASDGAADELVTRRLGIMHPTTQSHINPYLEDVVDTVYFKAIDQNGAVAMRKLAVHQKAYVFSTSIDTLPLDNGVFLEDGTRAYNLNDSSPKQYTFSLTTTGAWRLEPLSDAEQEWLEVDPATMSGGVVRDREQAEHPVRVWVKKQNLRLEDAVALLHFRPDYAWADDQQQLHFDVSVVQHAFDFEADLLNKDELSATQLFEDGVRRPIQVTSSGPWKICTRDGDSYRPIDTSDWIELDVESGNKDAMDEAVSMVQVGARIINPDNQSRSQKLYLLSELHEALPLNERYGYEPREVTIVQRRFTFRVNGADEASTLNVPAYMQSFDTKLQIESDGNWRIVSCPEWLSPSVMEADLSQGDVNLNVALNPLVYSDLNNSRSGKVSVTCSYPGRSDVTIDVDVVQSPLVFKVTGSSSAEFHPASNFVYNGDVLHPSSWNFSVEASDELPWVIVADDEYSMGFFNDSRFPSTFSGVGSLASGKLYPSYNSSQQTLRYNFHLQTDDSRFGTPVKIGNFKLTQDPFEWGSQTIGDLEFDALSGLRKGTATVSFMCSGPWELLDRPSWMPLSGVDYSSDPKFTVKVDKNTSLNKRSQTVTIRSLIGDYSKSFTVSQLQYFFDTSDTQKLEFSTLNATDQTVSFQCSGSWSVSTTDNLVFDRTSGDGDPSGNTIQLRFHPTNYLEESAARDTYFEIQSTMAGTTSYKKRVLYRQSAYTFTLNPSSVVSLSGPKDVSTRSVSVQVTNGEKWSARIDNENLATISPSGSQNGSGTIQIYPKANYAQSTRNATITVTTEVGNKTRTLTVSQPEYKFSTSVGSISFNADGGDKSFTVTSDGNWKLDVPSTATWLSVSHTSGSAGTVTVTVTALSNKGTGATDRSVTLTLKGSDDSSLTKTISVSQSK